MKKICNNCGWDEYELNEGRCPDCGSYIEPVWIPLTDLDKLNKDEEYVAIFRMESGKVTRPLNVRIKKK